MEESPKIGNHQNKETTLHLKEISNPYQNTKSETGSAGSGIKLGNKGEWIAEETEKKRDRDRRKQKEAEIVIIGDKRKRKKGR